MGVYRIYCGLKLNLRRKGKRRLPTRNPRPPTVPASANDGWSMNFMGGSLYSVRRFRTFNVSEDFN